MFYLIITWFTCLVKYFFTREPSLIIECVLDSGVLFIKMFQWLSVQPNLFSAKLKKKLKKLQDNCPQHSFKASLEKTKHIKSLQIEKTVIGCGSVAQVHLGTYKDKKCVVKITHPHIEEELIYQGNILKKFLRFIPIDLSEILPHWITQADLTEEAKNLSELRCAFREFTEISIPEVYYCCRDVLVQEYIDASPYNKLSSDLKEHSDVLRIASFLYLVFSKNLLHCDLHPGNILYKINSKKEINLYLIDPSPLIKIRNKYHMQKLIEKLSDNHCDEVISVLRKINVNPFVNFNNLEKKWVNNSEDYANSKELLKWCRNENVMIPGDISLSCIAYYLIASKFKNVNEKAIIYLHKYSMKNCC